MADYRSSVEEPIPFPNAFYETDDAAAQSQAAVLLSIGALMRYEEPHAREALAIATAPAQEELDVLPREERETLNLPPNIFRLRAARGARFDSFSLRESLSAYDRSYAGPLLSREEAEERTVAVLPRVAERFAESPEPEVAAALCEAALTHPDPLVRVAAASAYTDVGMADQQARAVQILVVGTYSDDPLVRDLAATALARVLPATRG